MNAIISFFVIAVNIVLQLPILGTCLYVMALMVVLGVFTQMQKAVKL